MYEPFKGWKYAHAIEGDRIHPIIFSNPSYALEDTAQCGSYRYIPGLHTGSHTVPGEYCRCGFYVLKHYEDCFTESMQSLFQHDTARTPNYILQVEVAGTIYRGTRGYRAQWQRVLGIYWKHDSKGIIRAARNLPVDSCSVQDLEKRMKHDEHR